MRKNTISSNEAGQRFDKYLTKYMKLAPTSFIFKMLRKKNIVLNKSKATGREILNVGDEVTLFLSDETIASFQPESVSSDEFENELNAYQNAYRRIMDMQIVYEDDNILVANKPSGILSQKSEKNDVSANDWLIGYLLSNGKITKEELKTFRPSICNRLDRNTSGLICCSKTLSASQLLSEMFANRSIHKYYRCRVLGKCKYEGRISSYLFKDSKMNKVCIFRELSLVPKELLNQVSMIETEIRKVKETQEQTELEICLITGKTHQIRAQLSDLGMPLIGDVKYGGSRKKDGQMLHCSRIEFPENVNKLPILNGKIISCEPPWSDL